MRATIGVYKCDMTEGAMYLLDVKEVARMVRVAEVVKETTDTFAEFEALLIRETNKLLGNIPQKTNESRNECEVVVTLPVMPRDSQMFYAAQHLCPIIVI